MSEGGKQAVRANEEVVPASDVRKLEDRVREFDRLLGRKTMEVELLKEALDLARAKTDLAVAIVGSGRFRPTLIGPPALIDMQTTEPQHP
jgi:transposase